MRHLLIVTMLSLVASYGQTPAPSFAFAVLGDSHINQDTPTAVEFTAIGTWITTNATAQKIQGVFSLGDFTGQDTNQVTNIGLAWTDGFSAIDALGKPWGVVPGNHDYDSNLPSNRRTTTFDAQIGQSRIGAKSWYGGYWTSDPNGDKANQYLLFTEPTSSRKFLILLLELYPRSGVLTWASGISTANPGREVIVFTHGFTHNDSPNTLADRADTYGPNAYSLAGTDASGIDIDNWAKTIPNIRAVICGHWINEGQHFNHSVGTASDGHSYYRMFFNWQDFGAPQWVSLLQFSATQVTVTDVAAVSGDSPSYATPYTVDWAPVATGLWPLPSPRRR